MRVGIIGLGYRLGYLSRVFSAARSDFSLAGYVDPAPAGLPYATEHGVSVGTQYDTLEALLDNNELDLLMIGSPNHLHLEHIRIGLERGLKIFTEKPVVTSVEETMELAKLIAQYGSDNLMVGLVLRYAPLYVDLRKAQAEGMLGDITSIEASEHIPPYHGAFFMRDWRRYERYSGSVTVGSTGIVTRKRNGSCSRLSRLARPTGVSCCSFSASLKALLIRSSLASSMIRARPR